MPLKVTTLHIYPVKGCRGTSPAAALAQARGFAGDRRWMIVDADGRFVSQRSRPPLALITPDLRSGCLELAAPGRPTLLVPLNEERGPRAPTIRNVMVWNDTVAAIDAGDEAAEWLCDTVGEAARLVFMPDGVRRAVDGRYGAPGDHVSFADAYPYLLISTASLDDLNARLPRPLPMDRFRPNLVVTGCAPYAEDGWRRVRIGPVVFRLVKPCTRCTVPTVDQATGTPDGPEPLRTLAGYRNGEDGVRFGMNVIAEGEGLVRAGDEVQPLD
jgi:uncharacterized protein YcbX